MIIYSCWPLFCLFIKKILFIYAVLFTSMVPHSERLRYTVRGIELWTGLTMSQLWPF